MAEIDAFWMNFALGRPERCSEEVSRMTALQPCDRTAVALKPDPDEPGAVYPVCANHARGEMVPLEQIVRFFLDRNEAGRRIARGIARMAEDAEMEKR